MTTYPWPTSPPTAAERAAFADAAPRAFWLDDLGAVEPCPALTGEIETDLCIVGGGFTGLWAALHAKADDPSRDVVVLEAETAGFGASGRNGGFVVAWLTHGIANGMARFEDELPALERLGAENLAGLAADVERHGIDCELVLTGELTVALEPHESAWMEEEAALLRRFGHDVELFADPAAMQAEVASPLYRAGVWDKDAGGLVHPGKLSLGLCD